MSLSLGLALVAAAAWSPSARAHGGPLDEYGGHLDQESGRYHYHKPARDMAARKREFMHWERLPISGELKGVVASVENAYTFWLHIPYRPVYQELTQYVSAAARDDRRLALRVTLSHVSPEETGARNPRFAEWFRSKVSFELEQKLREQPVRVEFQIVGGMPGRLRGMVFLGEENLNLWMVLNGWSYYVVSDGATAYDGLFRQAEDTARRDRAGIWEHAP